MEPIKTVEMHTGGEPLRLITEGISLPEQTSLMEKRRYLQEEADHYRRFLMLEPRGHKDMYGALIVPADHPDADFGVIFLHNEGYSTMCGHAIIALGRYAVDQGLVQPQKDSAKLAIQCPCGVVRVSVSLSGATSGAVTFESVPSFAFALNQFVNTDYYGPVELDIAYGGAFYGILEASSIGLDLETSALQDFITAAALLKSATVEQINLSHPDDEALGYLYGIIFTDGRTGRGDNASKNICVFAEGQVDRSPTGSGVTARLTVMAAKGETELGVEHRFKSITGALFTGKILSRIPAGPYKGLRIAVSGHAYYSGTAEFTVEKDDALAGGFLVR